MTRRAIVTLMIIGLAGLLPVVPAAAQPAGQPSWQPCPPDVAALDPRVECANVRVPLDYRRPSAGTIEVAISRVRTAKPDLRVGVLLFNPGGPGGAGLNLSALFAQLLPTGVLDRYDLIGFDPRGIGRSTPVSCGLTEEQRTDITKIIPYPTADGNITGNVRYALEVATACARTGEALLPFITTANTARDMDQIRAALGERKLSYLGYSYGSYLGAVYASLFPHRSDRIILDSVVHPGRIWRDTLRAWGLATEIRLGDFHRWVAARDAQYHLGATPGAVRQLLFDLIARLDGNPLPSNGILLTGNRFREANRGAMYTDALFPALAELYRFVLDNRGTESLPPQAAALFPEVPADNRPMGLFAVFCGDVAWPRSIARYARDVRTDLAAFPAVGGMAANLWPCATWPFPPREPPVTIRASAPVLLLQGLRDPATPYDGGQAMHAALGDRSRLVTVDIGGHGIAYGINFNRNACADAATTTYLITGQLPPTDGFCGPELATATTSTLNPSLDEALTRLRAQLRRVI